jgi:hypothetical protein
MLPTTEPLPYPTETRAIMTQDEARLVHIKNTLELEKLLVSQALLPKTRGKAIANFWPVRLRWSVTKSAAGWRQLRTDRADQQTLCSLQNIPCPHQGAR